MTFRVGQKVVCVSEWDNEAYSRCGCVVPRLRQILKVRDLNESGIRFEEITNAPCLVEDSLTGARSIDEPSFWPQNFRPIVERKTDISIFTKMLTPEGVDA